MILPRSKSSSSVCVYLRNHLCFETRMLRNIRSGHECPKLAYNPFQRQGSGALSEFSATCTIYHLYYAEEEPRHARV